MRIDSSIISVVYNPAYRPEIHELSRYSVDHPWLADEGHLAIITAARFVPQKDLETLLRAFAVVLNAEPDAKLVVLGDGPLRPQLEALAASLGISGSVSMPGADANPFRWFSKSKVFAMSSRWEGFGMTIVEAMACGCTVVSTSCPSGPSEILEDGKFGTLVPVGNPELMGTALIDALRSPRAGERNVARAKEFSLSASVDGYVGLMKAPKP
jgi:glycosyltransferase involved in cell wall biosynthesis